MKDGCKTACQRGTKAFQTTCFLGALSQKSLCNHRRLGLCHGPTGLLRVGYRDGGLLARESLGSLESCHDTQHSGFVLLFFLGAPLKDVFAKSGQRRLGRDALVALKSDCQSPRVGCSLYSNRPGLVQREGVQHSRTLWHLTAGLAKQLLQHVVKF